MASAGIIYPESYKLPSQSLNSACLLSLTDAAAHVFFMIPSSRKIFIGTSYISRALASVEPSSKKVSTAYLP
jgi:hypothetical protein